MERKSIPISPDEFVSCLKLVDDHYGSFNLTWILAVIRLHYAGDKRYEQMEDIFYLNNDRITKGFLKHFQEEATRTFKPCTDVPLNSFLKKQTPAGLIRFFNEHRDFPFLQDLIIKNLFSDRLEKERALQSEVIENFLMSLPSITFSEETFDSIILRKEFVKFLLTHTNTLFSCLERLRIILLYAEGNKPSYNDSWWTIYTFPNVESIHFQSQNLALHLLELCIFRADVSVKMWRILFDRCSPEMQHKVVNNWKNFNDETRGKLINKFSKNELLSVCAKYPFFLNWIMPIPEGSKLRSGVIEKLYGFAWLTNWGDRNLELRVRTILEHAEGNKPSYKDAWWTIYTFPNVESIHFPFLEASENLAWHLLKEGILEPSVSVEMWRILFDRCSPEMQHKVVNTWKNYKDEWRGKLINKFSHNELLSVCAKHPFFLNWIIPIPQSVTLPSDFIQKLTAFEEIAKYSEVKDKGKIRKIDLKPLVEKVNGFDSDLYRSTSISTKVKLLFNRVQDKKNENEAKYPHLSREKKLAISALDGFDLDSAGNLTEKGQWQVCAYILDFYCRTTPNKQAGYIQGLESILGDKRFEKLNNHLTTVIQFWNEHISGSKLKVLSGMEMILHYFDKNLLDSSIFYPPRFPAFAPEDLSDPTEHLLKEIKFSSTLEGSKFQEESQKIFKDIVSLYHQTPHGDRSQFIEKVYSILKGQKCFEGLNKQLVPVIEFWKEYELEYKLPSTSVNCGMEISDRYIHFKRYGEDFIRFFPNPSPEVPKLFDSKFLDRPTHDFGGTEEEHHLIIQVCNDYERSLPPLPAPSAPPIVPEVTVLWKLVFDNKKNPCGFMSVDDQENIQSLKLLAYAPDGIINFFDFTERPIVRKYINALKASNNSHANLSQSTLLWQKPGISRSSSADQPTPPSVAGRF